MPAAKKKTAKAKVKVKDLKAKKSPKGGAAYIKYDGVQGASKIRPDATSKIRF
ncbi:MAG: hypothetical protein ABIR71_03300 [Chthoniobacterales bacterium]